MSLATSRYLRRFACRNQQASLEARVSSPRKASRPLGLGSARAALISLLSRINDIPAESFPGSANTIHPNSDSSAGTNTQSRLGCPAAPRSSGDPRARSSPALIYAIDAVSARGTSVAPARREQVRSAGNTHPGHVNHVNAGHHLERISPTYAEPLPLPADAKLILPGLALA